MFLLLFHDHSKCDASSPCKKVSYIPDFIIVKDPVAVSLLTNFIKNTTVYKNAADFSFPRDTHHVESFNNVCLVYMPKRNKMSHREYMKKS